MMSLLNGLLRGANPFAMLFGALTSTEAVDEQLQALPVGGTLLVDIPDSLDPKVRSKGGKRFSIDRVEVRRLK